MEKTLPILSLLATATAHQGFAGIMSTSSLVKRASAGDGTFYTPGVGACGINNTPSDQICAMNAPDFGVYANPNNAAWCGKCVKVTGPKGSAVYKVMDRCEGCKSGDVDLSEGHFDKIADKSAGRVPITWVEVPCEGGNTVQPPAAAAPAAVAAESAKVPEQKTETPAPQVAADSATAPTAAAPAYTAPPQVAPANTAIPSATPTPGYGAVAAEKCVPVAATPVNATLAVSNDTTSTEQPAPANLQSGAGRVLGGVLAIVLGVFVGIM